MHRSDFISEYANKNGWTKGVELGVWHGKTMARVLGKAPLLHMIGVDAWAALPDGMAGYANWDHDSHEKQARENTAEFSDRVSFLKMTTDEAAKIIEDGTLDFVFIDADHRFLPVLNDIKNWLPKIKKGGVLMGHDIDWPEVKKAVEMTFRSKYKTGPDNIWFVTR